MPNKGGLNATFKWVVGFLRREQVRFAVVGGLAVSVQSRPRFTHDIDIAISVPSDEEAEELIRLFRSNGFVVASIVEQTATGRLGTARLKSRDGDEVDLLFSSSGIEPEIIDAAEWFEVLPQVKAPVASVVHLIAMKLLSRDAKTRLQDELDLTALIACMDDAKAAELEVVLRLITERKCHRQRRLVASWRRLWKQHRST